jgi:2-dehydro-3-deoxygluconokinase
MIIKPKEKCRWDLVALGEVMLRFDPGAGRISTTRRFDVFEGGGEYNVARGLKRCFGLDTAIVTAFVDNPVGRLLQDMIYQGGVDQSLVKWVDDDGVGRSARNGLNFTERGFGVRGAVGCSDRGHTAVSQLKPGEIDWDEIFGRYGARWFHTGGIFSALSETTAEVAEEAMQAARRHGAIVSYDLNYRASLWKTAGGKKQAQQVNRRLAPMVDVMLGNEEDFSAALGFDAIEEAIREYPFQIVASTLREATTASRNDWGAICYANGVFHKAKQRKDLEIYDRVGGGDSFASGLIYGFLTGQSPQWSVECGAAHGALAMTTPGDTSMATLEEVLQEMKGASPRISR